jgi:hypothetical protein
MWIGEALLSPPPVLRGRVGWGFSQSITRASPLPNPPPEYREREKTPHAIALINPSISWIGVWTFIHHPDKIPRQSDREEIYGHRLEIL